MMDVRPAHSAYGEPALGKTLAPLSASPVSGGQMPFEGHTRCLAENETCQAHRVKGEDYCAGHLRRFKKNGWV